MALNDPRVQLLANLKCLYGPNVEVLTLCVDGSPDRYQAVAMSFDPFTATWTKFLHSEPSCTTTRDAIETLLVESERELATLLSDNGNSVPFQGAMVQTMTLRRGQRRDSSTGSHGRSEFAFVATPGSTFSDTVPGESVHGEHSVEVTAPEEHSVNETPVEEAVVEEINECPVVEEPISFPEEPEPQCVEQEEKLETTSVDWSLWGVSKKDKKGKKKKGGFTFYKTQPAEEYSEEVPVEESAVEESPAEARVDESRVEEDCPVQEVCSPYDAIEEVTACDPEPPAPPPEDDEWGSFAPTKKSKKKKGKKSIKTDGPIQSPEPAEPAPEPVEDFGWGSFPASKKKKKGKVLIIEERLPSPEPEPVPEPVEDVDFGWGSFSALKKKKKGKMFIEEEVAVLPPEPEPAPEPVEDVDFGWGSFSTSKKMKKSKPMTEEEKLPSPELELVAEPVEETEEPKLDDFPTIPSPPPSDSQSRTEGSMWENSRPAAPLPLESLQVPRSRQTVVFTIQFPNDINTKPIQMMATIADNTRAAIIDAVHSYLDSKGMQGRRKLEIKCGVGRNGEVDLSALEENMWPEYLDYFRQYTRIPELTVDVIDC